MKKNLPLFIILIFIISLCSCSKPSKKYTDYSFDYFDTVTTIVGFEKNEADFKKNCEKIKEWLLEYHQLYDIYTLYDGVNNLCKINMSQEKEIKVEKEIIDLLEYSKILYQTTNGELNIALGSVLSIWHDYRDNGLENPTNASLPSKKLLEDVAKNTDINNLIIDPENNTVSLKNNIKLDVGGIAKGFAAQEISKKMQENGITGYILNIGGSI